jgi:ectoine hydroxylase
MLNEDQLKDYENQGFVIVPEFFNATEVKALQMELERFKIEGLGRNVNPTGQVNYQIMPLDDKSNLMRALLYNEKVLSCLRQLLKSNDIYRWLDQIFLKPARTGGGTEWHNDNAYFKIDDTSRGMGLWIAIHDANRNNGTMEMIPNSENLRYEYERSKGSDHHITAIGVDETRKVYAEVNAGGVIFFNFGILHCTRANTTETERAALAYHFIAQGAEPQNKPKKIVVVSGKENTGGLNEYGQLIAGSWDDEVIKIQQ